MVNRTRPRIENHVNHTDMGLSVIIADDHPIFRGGLREALAQVPGTLLAAEANDGLEAYQLILAKRPMLAVLDLEMPGLNGLEVCRKVLAGKTETRFIILTMHRELSYLNEAMQLGVMGYLLKDNTEADLAQCIREVMLGNRFVSPALERKMLEDSTGAVAMLNQLTGTERVVLKLVADGRTSPEIADVLFCSPNTVENHRASICRKLGISGKNALLKFALEHKGRF